MPRAVPYYKRHVKLGESVPPLPIATTAPITPQNSQIDAKTVGRYQKGQVLTSMEIRARIYGLMHKFDYDPVRELMEMATSKTPGTNEFTYPAEFRKSIHVELAQFVAPKLKATDIVVEGNMEINITVQKFGGVAAANREAVPVLVKEVREAAG